MHIDILKFPIDIIDFIYSFLFTNNPYICNVFFMVLDLRLTIETWLS